MPTVSRALSNTCRRAARRALSVMLAVVFVAASLPAPAVAVTAGSDYAYWFAYSQTKIYPYSAPPAGAAKASDAAPAVLSIGAAQSEFEGRQIAIRPLGAGLKDIWLAPSDLTKSGGGTIAASNVSAFKVGYVNITDASYGYGKRGIQPDPLLPMTLANGQRLGWRPGGGVDGGFRAVGAGSTQPFYVLFKVPAGTAPGLYTGTIAITCVDDAGARAIPVAIPVSLTVYPFSVAQRTLQTSFGLNMRNATLMNSASQLWLPRDPNPGPNAARVPERTTNAGDQIGGWMKFMSDHRITPQTMIPAWDTGSDWAPPNDAGDMIVRRDVLNDYLGSGPATTFQGERLSFNTIRAPEAGAPSYVKNPFTSKSASAKAARYYASFASQLGADVSKAIIYPIDEPSANKRKFIEKYTKFAHRYAPGAKFLLTTDPVTQKGKLLKGVDIYVSKLHFYFRESAWNKKIKRAHKQNWIYSHSTNWQAQTPLYLIDAPVTDSRVQGWMAYKARADGLLYWGINVWHTTRPNGTQYLRDVYAEPNGQHKTYKGKPIYASGDASLVYPGYYPPLGLVVEGSPPVSSLRMEALRDGLEDYEYLKLVAARYGTGQADAYTSRIVGKVPKARSGKLQFPPFARTPEPFEAVRAEMAAALSQ